MTTTVSKTTTPKSVGALVFGLLAFFTNFFFFLGLPFGIIGLVMANKGLKKYRMSPELYNGKGMLITGKIFSIIAIIFSSLWFLWSILWAAFYGGSLFGSFIELIEYIDAVSTTVTYY